MKKTIFISTLLAVVVGALAQTNLSGQFYLWPNWTHKKTSGYRVVTESIGKIVSDDLTHGTNANQMSVLASPYGVLTNSESATFNIESGITNSFGDAVTFGRVNYLSIKASVSNTCALTFAGAPNSIAASVLGGTNQGATIHPGGCLVFYAPDATGYQVGTNGVIKLANDAVIPDGLFAVGTLAIDSGIPAAFQTTNTAWWAVDGAWYTRAATTNLVFSSNDTINVDATATNLWGVWQVQINASSNITTRAPATNQVYTNAASAIAALPSPDASNISLGYILVASPTSTTFTANTTALTGLATFTDGTTSNPPSATYEMTIGGAE